MSGVRHGATLTLRCEGCQGHYSVTRRTAIAFLFLRDPECNHVVTCCALCRQRDMVFLNEVAFTAAVISGRLMLRLIPSADDVLRGQAAKAWAAVTAAAAGVDDTADTVAPVVLHELTPRLAAEVQQFAENLAVVPDELLWDALEDPGEERFPRLWADPEE